MATDQLLAAFTNLPSLVKICDKEMFWVILAASAWPLCQINIPENLLNPVVVPVPLKEGEEQLKRITPALLPWSSTPMLVREPKNSATRLLTAVVYFKLKRWFFNEGTQDEAVEKFDINAQALSKMLTRCRHMGGSDPRKKQTTIIQGDKGKLALLRKRKLVPSKVALKDPNYGDDDDDSEDQGKQHPPKKSHHDKLDQ